MTKCGNPPVTLELFPDGLNGYSCACHMHERHAEGILDYM